MWWVCIRVCVYVWLHGAQFCQPGICEHVRACGHTSVCVFFWQYVCVCACFYFGICVWVWTSVHVRMRVRVCVRKFRQFGWSDAYVKETILTCDLACSYGVATCSRLHKAIGLFCKRARWKRRYSAKETYNFKEPTNRRHPIGVRLLTLNTWHDSFMHMVWLIHVCGMTHSNN